ncbi:MAG TPA: ImmA/IrrE family metallo-endopeptidase [Terriglobales bacterium]|nr:ImmA/IrrE family metallo-endopeptidase [Terriglobales bacterium]
MPTVVDARLVASPHELAHSLLLHEPESAFDGEGTRDWDAEQEEEAQWLAGILLISEETALKIVSDNLSLEVAAKRYGASIGMIRGRLNVTGARKRGVIHTNRASRKSEGT